MRVNDVTSARLRELAQRRPARGKVLSLFLDLDPREFATAPARSSAITSLLDDARRRIEAADVEREEREGLRRRLAQVQDALDPAALPADGAAGLAVYASGSADLLEVLRLPRPVASRAVLADVPDVAPLAGLEERGGWCAALVSRGTARFLLGSADALAEDREVHRSEFDREVPSEVDAHLRATAATLARMLRDGRWERLLVGAPHELQGAFVELLDGELRERLAGTFDADVEAITAEQVAREVAAASARAERARLDSLLARFESGLGRGRAVAGPDETQAALEQRRVEALLLARGHEDGGAVRAALAQDASVHRVEEPEGTPFAPYRIGAVLRF